MILLNQTHWVFISNTTGKENFSNFSEISRKYKNILESSRMYWYLREASRIFQIGLECFTFHKLFQFSRKLQKVTELSRNLLNTLKSSRKLLKERERKALEHFRRLKKSFSEPSRIIQMFKKILGYQRKLKKVSKSLSSFLKRSTMLQYIPGTFRILQKGQKSNQTYENCNCVVIIES